ncbi:MAG TPA: rhodanese-like domain-containing protein [Nitrospirota bacterium]|nr:rhodanese-like domain-containing protein [Nitrospirota bacterium]
MKNMMAILALAVFITAGAVYQVEAADKTSDQFVKEAKAAIKEVTFGDVKQMIDAKENIVILDVRDKNELEDGRIPGAINISRGMLEFKVAMVIPDKESKIIVCCGVDLRSPLATKTLNDMGYKNAVNMISGLKVWKLAGYPLSK